MSLTTVGVNYQFLQGTPKEEWPPCDIDTAASSRIMASLNERVNWFINDALDSVTVDSWAEELKSIQLSYSGDEVLTALPLKACELVDGLPPKGLGGSVDPFKFATDEICDFLLHPETSLLPENEVPYPIPRAAVQTETDEDWQGVAQLLHERQVIEHIPADKIRSFMKHLLLNGAFAVLKPGT